MFRQFKVVVLLLLVACLTACASTQTKPTVSTETLPLTEVVPQAQLKPGVVLQKPANLYQKWTPPKRTLPADSTVALLAPAQYPIFTDDLDFAGLEYAISQSLVYFNRIPGDRTFKASGTTFTKYEIERGLWKFKDFLAQKPTVSQLDAFIRQNFDVYQSKGRGQYRDVLYTGYFEPIYQGSLIKTARFCYPVYGRPNDLVVGANGTGRYGANGKLIPYHTRAEIETQNRLQGKAEVLVWLESPVDAYFLHVQGSGRVILPDGQSFHLNYDAKNGREYKSLGAALIDGGHMTKEEVSMQGIYAFFAANPNMCQPLMHKNSSYVFFRAEPEGPYGSLAVPITPGRTLALDREIYPPGLLMLAQTQKPVLNADNTIKEWKPETRFMLNQDAGGAIKGAGRADFFWGNGAFATIAAGYMKHNGRLYFLLPKN